MQLPGGGFNTRLFVCYEIFRFVRNVIGGIQSPTSLSSVGAERAALGVSGLPSSLCGTRVKTREVFAEVGPAAPSVLLGHLAGQGM